MPATGDRVPTVYVENRHVVGLDPPIRSGVSYNEKVGDWPTGRENPDLLKMHPSHGHDGTIVNGISCIGFMTGGRAALWRDEEMAQTFAARAATFVEEQKDRRFFLYFAPHDPHVPRAPNQRFVGDPSMGPRGDAIVQADWAVGEIVRTLDRLRLTDNTNRETNTELGNDTEPQLYDLAADPGERTNVAEKFPAKANELHRLLDGLRAAGRSR